MDILNKAKLFAINAHKGQVRKSDPIKPMVIHPINVANILAEYGASVEVQAAGYLHDVVEDTHYTISDIEKEFGADIASLVSGATEPDKSLSWEERKQHTIDVVKNLDLDHKYIICADKISNLEDIKILFEIKGEYDFSSFKRGFESQKWYYEEIYKSLIENEDENLPIFIRLKELIDYVFNKLRDNYVLETIFNDKEDEYNKLVNFHYRKQEILKLRSVLSKKVPYVIEFTGTPRTGKTSLINNLHDFFKKAGFKVEIIEEFTTSKKYKTEIFPLLKDKYKKIVNTEIPKYVLQELNETLEKDFDIIIIDRSLFDRLIWVDRLFLKEGMNSKEYKDYKDLYLPLIKEKIDIIIATYAKSITALKRDYQANLSLEKRNFLNETNLDEYNNSLLNMQKLACENDLDFHFFDTDSKNQRQVSFEVIDSILDDMKEKYIQEIKVEFE